MARIGKILLNEIWEERKRGGGGGGGGEVNEEKKKGKKNGEKRGKDLSSPGLND